MGGEGGHGVLILSPRAVERLESYIPPRPLPKIFRLTKGGKLIDGIFAGETINTPSMLAVADAIDALDWMERIGGLAATRARADANVAALQAWVDRTPWIENLVAAPATRSNTSVCLRIVDPEIAALDEAGQRDFVKAHDQAPRVRGRRLRHRRLPRRAAGPARLVRHHRRHRRRRGADALARLGLRDGPRLNAVSRNASDGPEAMASACRRIDRPPASGACGRPLGSRPPGIALSSRAR